MFVLAVLALAVVSSSALPQPEAVPRRNDDAGLTQDQREHLKNASPVTPLGKKQEITRRSLDSLGGGNLLRQIDDGNRMTTGLQRTRQLDTLGNGNLLRRALDESGLPPQLDTLGGGWLLLRPDVTVRQLEFPDDALVYYLFKPGELDSLYDRLYNRRLTRNMNLDSLDGATFGTSKRFDSLNGGAFGAQKRNMDEIDHVGFNSFVKKNFDEIDRVGFNSFVKRPMDEIDRVGFNSFVKRPMDEIDRVGFNRFVKRPMDEIDRVGFDRFVKRH